MNRGEGRLIGREWCILWCVHLHLPFTLLPPPFWSAASVSVPFSIVVPCSDLHVIQLHYAVLHFLPPLPTPNSSVGS